MFTGIVEEIGEVIHIAKTAEDSAMVTINGPLVVTDARPGDSIAVNGVCLTVVELAGGAFTADVMGETLRRSALGGLRPGDPVNLERAVTLGSRLGGHLVQGHANGVGELLVRESAARWETVRFRLPTDLTRYVVAKGSITVDGVSLTVARVGPDWFEVGLIPTTLRLTTLGSRSVGDMVNLEVDVLAKYVERLLGGGQLAGPDDLPVAVGLPGAAPMGGPA